MVPAKIAISEIALVNFLDWINLGHLHNIIHELSDN